MENVEIKSYIFHFPFSIFLCICLRRIIYFSVFQIKTHLKIFIAAHLFACAGLLKTLAKTRIDARWHVYCFFELQADTS